MATDTQVEVVMPQMGVSVSEGTITKWLKSEGEPIARDESLLEISTDKVDTEIPSPAEGVVARILVQEGETVEVGTVLAVIAPEGAAVSAPEAPAPEPATAEAAEEVAAVSSSEGDAPVAPAPAPAAPAPAAQPAAPAPESGNGRTFVSPVVARIASEHGVDPTAVQGTGTGGRVTKKDILAFVEGGGQAATPQAALPEPVAAPEPTPVAAAPAPPPVQAPPPEPPPAPPAPPPVAPPAPAPVAAQPPPPPAAPAPAPAAETQAQPGETFEPMTAMRKGIAEHMRRSLDTSAHVTSAIEVDMSRVVAIRAQAEEGVRGGLRGQPDLPLLRRPGRRRDAARVSLDQRRDPRRQDRDAELRQPRLRGRARRREGTDRSRRQAHGRPEPARHGARGLRDRQARP